MPDRTPGWLLSVDRVEVGGRRIEAVVRVHDASALKTSSCPHAAEKLVSLLPGLARHTCHNDEGVSFVRELRDTEWAHCVEHATVELMALSGSPRTLRAETRWDFSADGPGVYRVTFDFDDDLVALAALKAAAELVEWAAGGCEPGALAPDVAAVAGRLRGLRGSR